MSHRHPDQGLVRAVRDRRGSPGAVTVAALAAVMAAAGLASPAGADLIVQQGSLSGSEGDPETHDIVLNQFDPATGTLNSVAFDFFTSVIGGGMSNGSGIPTHVYASLSADYFLGADPLGSTEAVIDLIISNSGPPQSFTAFDTDSDASMIDDAPGLAPWIGSGSIVMTAVTQFTIFEDPPDSVGFSAGGSVHYTVTYDYTPVPGPPAACAMLLALVGASRRRSRRR